MTTRAFTSALFLLVSTFLPLPDRAQAMECTNVFLNKQEVIRGLSYLGVSLFYAPALQMGGMTQIRSNEVLIEVYKPMGKSATKHLLAPYHAPANGLMMPFGKNNLHELGLKAIYSSYGPAVDPLIIRKVISAEDQLSLDRQATFLTKNPDHGEAQSFLRVFDGSIYDNGIRSTTDFRLPLEIILKSMNKQVSIVDKMRTEGAAVFEIGKYFITSKLDGIEKMAIRRDILNWMIGFIEARGSLESSKSFYFCHVASRAHRIAYERNFGFKLVPDGATSGLAPDENILYISGSDLLSKLKKSLAELELALR